MLAEGLNVFTVTTTNDAGVEESMVKMLESDTHCMLMLDSVDSPTTDATAFIRGWTDDDATVTVDGNGVAVNPDGTFEAEVALVEGDNVFVVEATDAVGNMASTDVTIVLDTTAPVITITGPADGSTVTEAAVTVYGTVDDTAAMVWVNGVAAEDGAGGFSAVVSLTEGDNTIMVVAVDELGNSASESITVTYAPPVYVTPDELDDAVDDLQDQIDDLVAQDQVTQDDIDELQTALDELMTSLEGQIGDLNESLLQEIADLQDQIDSLQEQIDEDVGDVNTRVDDANAFADLLMYLSIGLFVIAIVLLLIVWFLLSGKMKGGNEPEHSTEEVHDPGAPSDVEKEFEELEREISKEDRKR
jgi:prefoldin subunit 5